jgi:hypothetical protein
LTGNGDRHDLPSLEQNDLVKVLAYYSRQCAGRIYRARAPGGAEVIRWGLNAGGDEAKFDREGGFAAEEFRVLANSHRN